MYPGPWYGPGRHVHEGLGWGGWLLWVVFMVALWALVIAAFVMLVRSFTHRGPVTAQRAAQVHGGPSPWRAGGTGTVPAEQILAERFARGQIDENEYRSRLAVLRGEGVVVGRGGGSGSGAAATLPTPSGEPTRLSGGSPTPSGGSPKLSEESSTPPEESG